MVALAYAGCNAILSIIVLVLSLGFTGAINAGFLCNNLDIAPNYAGSYLFQYFMYSVSLAVVTC